MSYTKRVLLKVSIVFLIATTIILICHFNGLKQDQIKKANSEFGEYYEYKVNLFRQENANLKEGKVEVAFLGDSLTDLCDVKKYYQPYNVVNRGIGGDTTDGLLNRLDVSAYAFKPKVIVLLIGINNYPTMFNTYEDILIQLQKNLPYTKIIVLSLAPLGIKMKDANPTIEAQNKRLLELTKKYDIPYVDIYSALYNNETGAMFDEYTTDMVHFTDQGYKVISSIVLPVIKENLK